MKRNLAQQMRDDWAHWTATHSRAGWVIVALLLLAGGTIVQDRAAAQDGAQGGGQFRRSAAQRGTYRPPTLAPEEMSDNSAVVQVAHRSVLDSEPPAEFETIESLDGAPPENEEIYFEEGTYPSAASVQPGYAINGAGLYCDEAPPMWGCDAAGCDSAGWGMGTGGCLGDSCGGCNACNRTGLLCLPRLCSNQWFGSAQWLYWSRRGQNFPALAVNTTPNPDVVLFGGNHGEDGESGGRFSLGRWLDRCQTQSIEVRGWGLAEESFGFSVSGVPGFTVARPFFDAAGTAQFAEIIQAGSANTSEFLNIEFDSQVYGADALVHQVIARGLGARVDFLYGYQFFGVSENLTITSQAVTSATTVPPNAQLNVTDVFDVENRFHGGQLGLATRYDEGPWSFGGLVKVGLGAMQREANLQGEQSRLIPPPPAVVTPGGLLVSTSNLGRSSDSTFAVSPEVNLGLGYRLNPRMDFTIGYTYVMVTDALQVWRTIDTTVDAAANRPARNFTYGDYWVQGLNLGLNINY